MNLHHHHHLLLLLPLFCSFIFAPPKLALSGDLRHEACAPRNLTQPSYCSEPGFEISCKDNHPILSIAGKNFTVKSIFYPNKSLQLVDENAYKGSCGMPLPNVNLNGAQFSVASGNYNLDFFYNCTTQPGEYFCPVSRATDPSRHSYTSYDKVVSFLNYSGNYECQLVIRAPVDVSRNVPVVTMLSYADIVKMGSLVHWKANSFSECEDGGGVGCGSNNNKFVCFCPDWEHSKTCRNDRNNRMKIGIGVGAGAGFLVMVSTVFFVLYMRRRKKYSRTSVVTMDSSQTDFERGSFSYGVPVFDYDELAKATNNFDPAAELGDGGFGTVFKGKLRDGRVVAVKRLYEHNCKRLEQFVNEVDILARLRHPNLICLYGCTSQRSSRLLLVYEYISNGTVADHIHGDLAKPGLPPWLTRLNIAVETATALVYLHTSDVIHRDLKTNNILLDENFTVKVADFGLSRLFPQDVTHISTAPQGTPGYVDPEYHQCYQLTEKSDVYSFGVVLIELVSSLPAVDIMRHRHEINLSALALNKIQANALHELVDAHLGFQSNENTREMITAVVELAFQCLQPQHEERPSMTEVLETLIRLRKCGCNVETVEDGIDTSDDAVLLKNNPLMLSPDSVTVKWVSSSSTSTTANVSV